MVIRRPIEFAHISLAYSFTTMPILETGAISSKRAADPRTLARCHGLTQSAHHRDHRGQLLGARPNLQKAEAASRRTLDPLPSSSPR